MAFEALVSWVTVGGWVMLLGAQLWLMIEVIRLYKTIREESTETERKAKVRAIKKKGGYQWRVQVRGPLGLIWWNTRHVGLRVESAFYEYQEAKKGLAAPELKCYITEEDLEGLKWEEVYPGRPKPMHHGYGCDHD